MLIIGFAVNNLLPARLGEFARAYMLGQREDISKSLSFATVVVERLLDGLTLLVFLLALSFFFPLPGWGQRMGFLAALFFLGALAFLFFLLYREAQALRLVRRISSLLSPSWADSLERLLTSFVAGVESLRQRHLLPGLALLSVSIWAFEATSYFFLTWAFPISLSPLSRVMAALFVTVVVNLGVLIPSSPGYVGTFHFFAMSALSVFGAGREVALSYAVVSHAMQYILITGLGLYFLWRENLSLARLGAAATSEAKG